MCRSGLRAQAVKSQEQPSRRTGEGQTPRSQTQASRRDATPRNNVLTPVKWSQFLRWLHCNQLPGISYIVSSRNPVVLRAVWYLNKWVIHWGAEILLELFTGVVFLWLDWAFITPRQRGKSCLFWIKRLPFLNCTTPPFYFPALISSHIFSPWIFHLETQPILTKPILKIQGCLLSHVVFQDFLIVSYLFVSCTQIQCPGIPHERRIQWEPALYLSFHYM